MIIKTNKDWNGTIICFWIEKTSLFMKYIPVSLLMFILEPYLYLFYDKIRLFCSYMYCMDDEYRSIAKRDFSIRTWIFTRDATEKCSQSSYWKLTPRNINYETYSKLKSNLIIVHLHNNLKQEYGAENQLVRLLQGLLVCYTFADHLSTFATGHPDACK